MDAARTRLRVTSIKVPTGLQTSMAASSILASPAPAPPHQAASTGRRLGGWRPTGSGPNAIVAASGPELVRRSRDLQRNNPHARRAIGLVPTHVVGIGIKPRPMCRNNQVRKALSELWAEWVKVSDADGVLDFYGQQVLAVREMGEAGESFARLRTRRLSDGLPVPLQVQLLPAEQVPLEYNTPYGTNSVTQGIERNALLRRVAYWCRSEHPNDWTGGMLRVDLSPRPVPAEDMCHLYNVIRIGQLRGLPWLAGAVTTLHQLGSYLDAELLRKQMAAALVAFVRKAFSEDIPPEQAAAAFGQLQQMLADLPTVELEPGTVQYLNPGEDITFSQPADVGANFEAFVRVNLQSAAAALDVLYEELSGDWSRANDRLFRAQFNTFKRQVQQWQYGLVVAQFSQPVWDRFVTYAVSSGALKQPKSVSDAELRRVAWLPHRHEYIQPVQDVEATALEMEIGLNSRANAVAERGDDVEDIDDQVEQDRQRERAKGLNYGRGAKPQATKPALDEHQSGQGAPNA